MTWSTMQSVLLIQRIDFFERPKLQNLQKERKPESLNRQAEVHDRFPETSQFRWRAGMGLPVTLIRGRGMSRL